MAYLELIESVDRVNYSYISLVYIRVCLNDGMYTTNSLSLSDGLIENKAEWSKFVKKTSS